MFKQYRKYRIGLILVDYALAFILLIVVDYALPFVYTANHARASNATLILFYVVTAVLWHMAFVLAGVYRLNRLSRLIDHLLKITPAHLLACLLFAGLLFYLFPDAPRAPVVYLGCALYICLIVSRIVFVRLLLRKRRWNGAANALFVGASPVGVYLARTLMEEHRPVCRVAGFIEDDPPTGLSLPVPILGSRDDAARVIKDYHIDFVIIAEGSDRPFRVESLIAELAGQPVRIYLVADVLKMALVHGAVERIGDLLVVGMREPAIQGPQRVMKRIMDIVVSSVGLFFIWPILLTVAVLIKCESRGPIFYIPQRIGEYGKTFAMYKFRTMYVDAERRQAEVAKTDENGNIVYKTADDPRVTKVGKWLRRSSVDELPQLWNVLKGDMSLVGPRPEQPFLTEYYGKREWQRTSVPPGITGWWQVQGRSDLPLHLSVEHDIYYVYNYSVWLDLKILFLTLWVVWKGKGAY